MSQFLTGFVDGGKEYGSANQARPEGADAFSGDASKTMSKSRIGFFYRVN